MKRNLVFSLALGLASTTLVAQTAPAPATAQPTAPAPSAPPQAIPAKVAIIAFSQVVIATNEGQRAFADVQKKYEPQKAKIDAGAADLEKLKQRLQALPANAPDDQRAPLVRDIDQKEKQLQLDAEGAQNSYNEDLDKAFNAMRQKVGNAAVKYCTDNGFTMLLDAGPFPQSPNPVLWWAQTTDISQAVVNAYNTSSGVAAPAPGTPSAPRPKPAATTPARPAGATTTAPKK